MNKLLKRGEAKIEHALDIRSILKMSRILHAMLRLEYSPAARKRIAIQRHEIVLENDSTKEFSPSTTDKQMSFEALDEKEKRLGWGVFFEDSNERHRAPQNES